MRRVIASALLAVAACAVLTNATCAVLTNDFLNVTLTVSPNGTCVSSLAFNLSLAAAQGWTPNLLSGGLCAERAWSGASL